MIERLQVVIRTPHERVLDAVVRAVRVPTETGQVGLRPRQEPLLLGVEPGLVILRTEAGVRLAATAGGLLHGDRQQCVLYTPFAVLGEDEAEVLAALERAFGTPDSELVARKDLDEIERRIVLELRRGAQFAPGRSERDRSR